MKKHNQNTLYGGLVRFSSVSLVVLLSLATIYYSYLLYRIGDMSWLYVASITTLIALSLIILYSSWRHLLGIDIQSAGINPAQQLNSLCHCASDQTNHLNKHLDLNHLQMGDGRRVDVTTVVQALSKLNRQVSQLTLYTDELVRQNLHHDPVQILLEYQQLDSLLSQLNAAEHDLYSLKLVATQAGISQSPTIADSLTTIEDVLIQLHDLSQNYLQPHLDAEQAKVEASLSRPPARVGKRRAYSVPVQTNFFGQTEPVALTI